MKELAYYDGRTYEASKCNHWGIGAMLRAGWTFELLVEHGFVEPITMPGRCQNPECVECYGMPPYTQEQVDAMNAERELELRLEVDASQASAIINDAIQAAVGVSATTATLINQIIERDAHGKAKYGTTLDRTDLSLTDWLQHQAEELADGAGYALAAKREAERLLEIKRLAGWLVMGLNEHAPRLRHDTLKELNALLEGEEVQPPSVSQRARDIEQAAWALVRADEAVKYGGNPDNVKGALDDLRSTLKRA